MAVKIRFQTEIKTVPYFIHTGTNHANMKDALNFIKGTEYKRYVAESFMNRKKIAVMSTDIVTIEGKDNALSATLSLDDGSTLNALIECFECNTGRSSVGAKRG